MGCPFNSIIRAGAALLIAIALLGCVSLRIEKVQQGGDVLPPAVEFLQKKTLLSLIHI